MTTNDFLIAIQPALVALALAILSGSAIVATAFFQSLAAKLKESKDREALHSALKRGAILGNIKYPEDARQATELAVDYTHKSTPDAVCNLIGKDDPRSKEVMDKLGLSYVVEEREKKP
jgi:hypothetical protein